MNDIKLYNSISGKKEKFVPIDKNNIKLYVCGPTVYDKIHLGNARSVVIYDCIFRFLRHKYNVTYVRNITDIDDKIISQAKKLHLTEKELTDIMIKAFKQDCKYLMCLEPTFEPKATQEVPEMIKIIQKLIENSYAYEKDGNIIFSVQKYKKYGLLSKREITNNLAGSRIAVQDYKNDPNDFILWKKSNGEEIAWPSPWGNGRPGWHIECSAMSMKFLGKEFDIHGGGVDLKFPHHENEIAQSVCCYQEKSSFANYWVHNGFLMVDNQKMSKSLGNFTTVEQIREQGVKSQVLRLALLSCDYKKPLNFTQKLLSDSKKIFDKIENLLYGKNAQSYDKINTVITQNAINILANDLNFPKYISYILNIIKNASIEEILFCLNLIGLDNPNKKDSNIKNIPNQVIKLAEERFVAKKNKNFELADQIRKEIENLGYNIIDTLDGYKLS
jgi:cysteinyl-tRNA synthetase